MCYIWQGRGCGTQLPGGGLELSEQQTCRRFGFHCVQQALHVYIFFIFSAF